MSRKIAEIALFVNDVSAAAKFYEEVLNTKPVEQSNEKVIFKLEHFIDSYTQKHAR